ncbi:MAG: hypothetical protein LBJ67_19070 [Planctomycetaceae bacterium]|jgi:TolA-binding protein|nr:hypothetical protein [Planctomycetaceae bacterium]
MKTTMKTILTLLGLTCLTAMFLPLSLAEEKKEIPPATETAGVITEIIDGNASIPIAAEATEVVQPSNFFSTELDILPRTKKTPPATKTAGIITDIIDGNASIPIAAVEFTKKAWQSSIFDGNTNFFSVDSNIWPSVVPQNPFLQEETATVKETAIVDVTSDIPPQDDIMGHVLSNNLTADVSQPPQEGFATAMGHPVVESPQNPPSDNVTRTGTVTGTIKPVVKQPDGSFLLDGDITVKITLADGTLLDVPADAKVMVFRPVPERSQAVKDATNVRESRKLVTTDANNSLHSEKRNAVKAENTLKGHLLGEINQLRDLGNFFPFFENYLSVNGISERLLWLKPSGEMFILFYTTEENHQIIRESLEKINECLRSLHSFASVNPQKVQPQPNQPTPSVTFQQPPTPYYSTQPTQPPAAKIQPLLNQSQPLSVVPNTVGTPPLPQQPQVFANLPNQVEPDTHNPLFLNPNYQNSLKNTLLKEFQNLNKEVAEKQREEFQKLNEEIQNLQKQLEETRQQVEEQRKQEEAKEQRKEKEQPKPTVVPLGTSIALPLITANSSIKLVGYDIGDLLPENDNLAQAIQPLIEILKKTVNEKTVSFSSAYNSKYPTILTITGTDEEHKNIEEMLKQLRALSKAAPKLSPKVR